MLLIPPQEILFLDTNICIEIYEAVSKNISYDCMDDILKLLKDKNRPTTVVFAFPYLLEGGYRKECRDYEENIYETLDDAEYVKKFFDKSLCDMENFKHLEEERKKFGIGRLDFQFEGQIKFYKSLRNIIYNRENKKKIDIQTEIINKVREYNLKLYYPIVISSIAVLYQKKNSNFAESFLKLKKRETDILSKNVVNDMINILRYSSSSYGFMIKFFKNYLHVCNIEFVTKDKDLDKFIKLCNIQKLYYLIKGKQTGSCPIDREYFPLASDVVVQT